MSSKIEDNYNDWNNSRDRYNDNLAVFFFIIFFVFFLFLFAFACFNSDANSWHHNGYEYRTNHSYKHHKKKNPYKEITLIVVNDEKLKKYFAEQKK